MTPEARRQALAVLAEVCALAPEVRLGQMMAHLGFLGEVHVGQRLGDIEDDELLALLYRHRAELLARQQGQSSSLSFSDPAVSVSGSPTRIAG